MDLSQLPPGQRRAVEAFIGGGTARTYPETAKIAGVSLGTVKTHLHRIKYNHPAVYSAVRSVRESQLAVRHEIALENTKQHSRAYFRRQNRSLRRLLGYSLLYSIQPQELDGTASECTTAV